MSWLEKFNWNPLTPGKLPAGARISAVEAGSVEISLPATADVLVNCVPVNCIPSPESPAKRIVTVSTSSWCFTMFASGGSISVLIWLLVHPFQIDVYVLIRASTQCTALRNYPHPHNNSRGFLRDDRSFPGSKNLTSGSLGGDLWRKPPTQPLPGILTAKSGPR